MLTTTKIDPLHNLDALSTLFNDAYGVLIEATRNAGESAQAVDDARKGLEERKAQILCDYAADPKALGSNEESRKAKLLELCGPERDLVLLAEYADRKFALAVTLAKLDVDACDRQLRILEALATIRQPATVAHA